MTIEKATSQWKESFIAIRNIPRFLNLVYKSNRRLFILNLILRLIKAFMPVALLWIGKEIIDEIILQAGLVDKEFTRIFTLIILEFTLALLSDVFSRIISMTDGLIGDLYANESSVELIQKTAKVELAQLEDSEFYDKLERARRQTTNRISLMSDVMSQVQDLITIVSLISALIYFYPLLIILLAISIIPSFLNEIKFSNSSYSLQRRWTPERRELDYMRMIGASDVTAKEVKLFGLADFISDTFARVADKYFQANKKLAVHRTFWGITYNIIGDIAYYSAYVFIVLKAVAGAVTIGDLTFLAGSFGRLRNQMQSMFSRFTRISQSALYLQDYFDFIDMEFQYDTGFERKILPTKIQTGFEFKDVSFRYPGTEVDVLKSISFHLDKNEKLALVGENGAGKTTLVKLMLRLYEPTAGAILMDGVDIRHYDKAEYQQLFGAIFQDFVKYYLTAKVNIAVGNIEELENQKRIEESAVRSLASEVIEELPNGYEQELGKRFRSGTELSGGQWQKIALARAYMTDAPVIILDEPTAALDARAEYEVFQRFIGLTKGKVSIIISHRFSTVRMADRILVLSGGEILEIGSHKQLLANNQLYSELFNLQAAGYK